MKKYFFAIFAALSLLSFGVFASPTTVFSKSEVQGNRTASVSLQGNTLTESVCVQQTDATATRSLCTSKVSQLTDDEAQAFRQDVENAHSKAAAHAIHRSDALALKQSAISSSAKSLQDELNTSFSKNSEKKTSAKAEKHSRTTSRSSSGASQPARVSAFHELPAEVKLHAYGVMFRVIGDSFLKVNPSKAL